MKVKKSVLIVLALIVAGVFSVNAQMSFSGGVSIGTKMSTNSSGNDKNGYGLNVRMNYPLRTFVLSTGFSYFFLNTSSTNNMTVSQFNVDGHYTLGKIDIISFYGITGLNYSFIKRNANMTIGTNNNTIGADLGAGIKFSKFFVEGKYDTSLEQIVFSGGFKF